MAEPFIGEIRSFSFSFAPSGWATCDGQRVDSNQNPALFSLLGTLYGGDGKKYFLLPDLRGRTPIQYSDDFHLGDLGKGGAETITLNISQIPQHTHKLYATTDTSNPTHIPSGALLGTSLANYPIYADMDNSNKVVMYPETLTDVGGNTGHNNMQPYLVINFCIALLGYYPSRD